MPITVTLAELVNAFESLNKVAQLDGLTLRASYDVCKLLKLAEPKLQAFHTARSGWLKKFGETEDGGKTYTIPEDKRETASAELKEVLDEEVVLEASRPTLSGDIVGLKPAEIFNLMPFIEVTGNGSTAPAGD